MSEPAQNCIFCSIVAGQIPSSKVYEDEQVYAFRDLDPQAPTHVLVVPKKHLTNIVEVGSDAPSAQALLAGIAATARAEGVDGAFRTVFNTGAEVGQSVFHVHAHVLAGRAFGWPPG